MAVLAAKTGPLVMRKLASLPVSRLPTLSYTPSNWAGVRVSASRALVSESPYSIAFLRLARNALLSLRSAVVRQKGIPAFSNAAGLAGASSQFLRSARDTNLASLGSSTSIACGKFRGTIKVALVPAISRILWYSLPPPLMMYCTPNSSPILSALSAVHLSVASKSWGRDCISFHAFMERFVSAVFSLALYHLASR